VELAVQSEVTRSVTVWDFSGKTLLVTGATGGIGRATAALFGKSGANLVLVDIDPAVLADVGASLDPSGTRTLSVATDVTQMTACESVVARTVERFGGIDILVPSAGIYRDEMFATMTPEQWRRTMAVNLDGVFNIIRAALPAIRPGGSIINLASRAAHSGGSLGHAHYGATKGGILALTRGLARELGPKIRVNAVSPGVIETPMTAEAILTTGEEVIRQTPLARFGTADEVASAISFLASEEAAFITGETIHVNGGIYMD
jgi:3-oxoacyl-[acyl-carrier protein] reductase